MPIRRRRIVGNDTRTNTGPHRKTGTHLLSRDRISYQPSSVTDCIYQSDHFVAGKFGSRYAHKSRVRVRDGV